MDSFLDHTSNADLWTVDVPAGSASFRAAINLQSGGGADFELYVRHGSAPTVNPFEADCFSLTAGNAPEYCAINQPEAGTYYILVRRVAGNATIS